MSLDFAIPGLMPVGSPKAEIHQAPFYENRPIYVGDTWDGVPVIRCRISGAAPTAPAVAAQFIFYREGYEDSLTLEYPDGVTCADLALWEFTVPPQILPFGAGAWQFRFRTEDSEGDVKTWLRGELVIL